MSQKKEESWNKLKIIEKTCPCKYWRSINERSGYCSLIGKRLGKCHFNEASYPKICVVWLAVEEGLETTGVPLEEIISATGDEI